MIPTDTIIIAFPLIRANSRDVCPKKMNNQFKNTKTDD